MTLPNCGVSNPPSPCHELAPSCSQAGEQGRGQGGSGRREGTLHPPQLPRQGRQQLGSVPGASVTTSQQVTPARFHLSSLSLSSSLTSKLTTLPVTQGRGICDDQRRGLVAMLTAGSRPRPYPAHNDTQAPRERAVCSALPHHKLAEAGQGLGGSASWTRFLQIRELWLSVSNASLGPSGRGGGAGGTCALASSASAGVWLAADLPLRWSTLFKQQTSLSAPTKN